MTLFMNWREMKVGIMQLCAICAGSFIQIFLYCRVDARIQAISMSTVAGAHYSGSVP